MHSYQFSKALEFIMYDILANLIPIKKMININRTPTSKTDIAFSWYTESMSICHVTLTADLTHILTACFIIGLDKL